MKILIDNGHGENTKGKRSPDGRFREYSFAREIAERVVNGLRQRGYDAERLVRENMDVALCERTRRVNEECGRLGKSNVLLVSIHVNAAGNGEQWMKATGWSAYTSKGKTKSDTLADCLHAEAEKRFKGKTLRKDMSDGDPDWEENFYVLQKTKCAAVLTENFFQDNADDVAYLESPDGMAAVTDVHIEGIIRYLNLL